MEASKYNQEKENSNNQDLEWFSVFESKSTSVDISLKADLLLSALSKAHFNGVSLSSLEEGISQDRDMFEVNLYQDYEKDKMLYRLQFSKAQDGYEFTSFQARLFQYIEVQDTHINGVNIKSLDESMQKADWYYEYAESPGVWRKGDIEIEEIKANLQELDTDEKGKRMASTLWNNHVPMYSISKPDFIRQWETTTDMYPSRNFDPIKGATANQAYRILKEDVRLNSEIQKNNNYSKVNKNVMDTRNLEYLSNQVRNHGFGDLKNDLEVKINTGATAFNIEVKTKFNNQRIEATLHFAKAAQGDRYFFNSHTDTLKKSKDIPEDRTHKFHLHDGQGATFKMAYNLLAGNGPVNMNLFENKKDRVPWSELDLKTKLENGNFKIITHPSFSLVGAISKYNLQINDEDAMKMLVSSLQRGNIQAAKTPDGETVFIHVNAKDKDINIRDREGVQINTSLIREKVENSIGQTVDNGQAVSKGKAELSNASITDTNSLSQKEDHKAGLNKDNSPGTISDKDKSSTKSVKDLIPQKTDTGKGKSLSV